MAATLEAEVFSLREWHVLPGRKLIFPGTDETGVYCNLAGTGLLETSFTAEHTAQLPSNETILAPKGHVSDPKRDAAVQFARKVIETCGEVDRRAGGHVLPDKLFNNVFDPERDLRAVRWLVRSELYTFASTISEGPWRLHVTGAERQSPDAPNSPRRRGCSKQKVRPG